MLEEIKTKTEHYFKDDKGFWQGEYRRWHKRKWYECLFRKKRIMKAHRFYIDGLIHGECKRWHDNGILSSYFVYINGSIDGEYKQWSRDGSIYEHYLYVDGEAHGEYKLFNRNGSLREHCFLVNGDYTSFDEIPYPETEEDRMYFKLKYDIPLLPVETTC